MDNQRRIYPYYIGVIVGKQTSLALWSVEKKKIEKLTTLPFNDALKNIEDIISKKGDVQVRYEDLTDIYSDKFAIFVNKNEIPNLSIPQGYVGGMLGSKDFYEKTKMNGNNNERRAAAIVLDL